MLRTAVPFLIACLALPAAAQSTLEMLAIDFNGQLFGVDARTGQSRNLGPTGLSGCNAMAHLDNRLIVNAKDGGKHQLVEIDPVDYRTKVLFPHIGLDVRGMTFRDPNQLLLIVNGPTNADSLVRFDLQTGAAQLIGPTGRSGIQALAGNGSTLWAWDVTAGLLAINASTGAATDPFPLVGTLGASIQFLATSTGALLGGNSALFEISTTTGRPTFVGSGGYFDLRGADLHRGRSSSFGSSCQSGVFLGGTNVAIPGGNFVFSTAGHEPNAPGVLHIGFQRLATPLPGGPCSLLVSDDQQFAVTMNPAGVQKFALPLPTTFGLTLHTQLTTIANVPGGLLVTNGVTIELPN